MVHDSLVNSLVVWLHLCYRPTFLSMTVLILLSTVVVVYLFIFWSYFTKNSYTLKLTHVIGSLIMLHMKQFKRLIKSCCCWVFFLKKKQKIGKRNWDSFSLTYYSHRGGKKTHLNPGVKVGFGRCRSLKIGCRAATCGKESLRNKSHNNVHCKLH